MHSPTRIVQVAGRQVAVTDAGPESGFPVIVHHAGTRHLFPGAVRDAQVSGLRLISYDRSGLGQSTPQPGRVVADCARDVRAILADLGLSRAAVRGAGPGQPRRVRGGRRGLVGGLERIIPAVGFRPGRG